MYSIAASNDGKILLKLPSGTDTPTPTANFDEYSDKSEMTSTFCVSYPMNYFETWDTSTNGEADILFIEAESMLVPRLSPFLYGMLKSLRFTPCLYFGSA